MGDQTQFKSAQSNFTKQEYGPTDSMGHPDRHAKEIVDIMKRNMSNNDSIDDKPTMSQDNISN